MDKRERQRDRVRQKEVESTNNIFTHMISGLSDEGTGERNCI